MYNISQSTPVIPTRTFFPSKIEVEEDRARKRQFHRGKNFFALGESRSVLVMVGGRGDGKRRKWGVGGHETFRRSLLMFTPRQIRSRTKSRMERGIKEWKKLSDLSPFSPISLTPSHSLPPFLSPSRVIRTLPPFYAERMQHMYVISIYTYNIYIFFFLASFLYLYIYVYLYICMYN